MYKDSDGQRIREGDALLFCYGIPPVHVRGLVVTKRSRLVVLTPGHDPSELPLSELKDAVGDYWVEQQR